MTNIKFNMNDYIRVKLTARGVAIHKQSHEKLMNAMRPNGAYEVPKWLAYEPPKLEADGYWREQLWQVMQLFGPHILVGMYSPIETEIIIEV
jgi:hypothetical protein